MKRLGLPGHSRPLIVSSLVDSTGTGLFLSGSAVFFTRSAGLSTSQVGIGLTVAGLCGFLALPPLGMLADRIGPRAVSVLLHLWQAAGFAAYALVHSFPMFLLVACTVGIPAQAVQPIAQMFIERHAGKDLRMRLIAVFRSVYNVGFTLGALLTTVALTFDTRAAYLSIILGDAVSFLLAGLLLLRVPLLANDATTSRPARTLWPRSLREGSYLAVAGLNAVMVLHMSLLSVALPLWATLHTEAPRAIVGPLLVINTVMAVLLQVRVSRGADSLDGAIRAMRWAAVSLAACSLVLATAGELPAVWAAAVLVLGVVLLTSGELFQSAAGWGLSYQLAPAERQGEYLAIFGLGVSAQYLVGPALLTIGVIEHGASGWIALAVLFGAAGLLVPPVARAAERRMERTAVPVE
ncbi:MFS transporter [Streptomyces sp. 8N706]|uniref:MFS transporter n=1 Tax=Streptomyces sp. 8N706 TaxID=3457416 RepID=UPI003FD3CD7E